MMIHDGLEGTPVARVSRDGWIRTDPEIKEFLRILLSSVHDMSNRMEKLEKAFNKIEKVVDWKIDKI